MAMAASRERGNEAYKARRYAEALEEYSAGIAACEGSDAAAVLHLNAAACALKLKRFVEAATHCDAVLQTKAAAAASESGTKMRAKALFRLACAREGEGQPAAALAALQRALRLAPRDKALRSKLAPMKSAARVNEAALDRIVRTVVEQRSAGTDFAGTFQELMDPTTFRRLICWGESESESGSSSALVGPTSLQSVLTDAAYRDDLLATMPRVAKKTESILEGVKRRGAAAGQAMDAQTEARLRPQIEHEAFAKEIVAMLQRVARRQNAQAAQRALRAPPGHECATWDQLPAHAIVELADAARGWTIIDDYLGEDGEWADAVHDDILRLDTLDEKLQRRVRGDGSGEKEREAMLRVEPNDATEASYPALFELLTHLHALPFELNAKVGPSSALCLPMPGSTAVLSYDEGAMYAERLDAGRGADTNGYKITAIYFPHGAGGEGGSDGGSGALALRPLGAVGGEPTLVVPKRDRLVLFRSAQVLNAMRPCVGADASAYRVAFWIHGGTGDG